MTAEISDTEKDSTENRFQQRSLMATPAKAKAKPVAKTTGRAAAAKATVATTGAAKTKRAGGK